MATFWEIAAHWVDHMFSLHFDYLLYPFSGFHCQFVQGHWREFSIRNCNSLTHTLLLNVFSALKGTHFYILLDISRVGFEGWSWVLIDSVPDLCIRLTFQSVLVLAPSLNDIWQSDPYCARLIRSSCKICQSSRDFISLYKTQSSAKRRTDDLIFSGRSFIKMRNRTGPKTNPWGTPDRTGTGSEA